MPTTAQAPSLADVRAVSVDRRRAEVDEIVAVVAWLEQHVVDPRTSADVAVAAFGDGELLLAGEGAPAVSEAAVVELLTTLGRSDSAGRVFIGRCLELRYRLPRLWLRVLDGEVEVWRAFRVAEATQLLPLDGAAHVDAALAPFAHSMSWAQLERTVEAALVEFDPERAERLAGRDPRRFAVHTPTVDGFVHVEGILDLPDARDLDASVAAGAAQLADLGCDEPLDVRRSMALGEIARAQLALDLTDRSAARGVTLYVHLSESAVATVDGVPVLADHVATWCADATATIKPVIDLNQAAESVGYTPSDAVAERVRLAWPQCVFPFCTRRARTDLDHRIPWPDGATSSANLAPLCRTHHRMKTFAGWSYVPAATTDHGVPIAFTWTSPGGSRFRVDQHGSSPEP